MPSHFAVVGQSCPGFDAFLEYLKQVPDLDVLTHLFDRSDYLRMSEYDAAGLLIRVGEEPGDFLDLILESRQWTAIAIRYEEAADSDWVHLWSYIRGFMPIVHYKHANPFKLLLSRSQIQPPIYLDGEILEAEIDRLIGDRREHDIILQHGQVIDAWHEELVKDPRKVEPVLEFLGIGPMASLPDLPTVQPHCMLDNYDELKQGRLREFFDD